MTEHGSSGWSLVVVGSFLLAGVLAHVLGRRAHVPRVSLLLLLGVAAGPSGLDLVPDDVHAWFPVLTSVALSLVGFMLGERFFGKRTQGGGRLVTITAGGESIGAAVAVFLGTWAVTGSALMAVLLAGIAPASDPAATVEVIDEGRARGQLSDTLLGVVALDDAYGIVLFSVSLVAAQLLHGGAFSAAILGDAAWEVGGAVLLGFAIGIPMAWVTGRARPGELTLLEALGFVLLCGGAARMLDVSYLLACMTLGAVVARLARHHRRPLHAIEGVSEPFLVGFFLLAGFEFDLSRFLAGGVAGAAYIALRSAGKVGGGWLGARLGGGDVRLQRHIGWCLLPQAGVALGLGLVAAQRVPEIGEDLLSLVVGTTFAFEIVGPVVTRIALRHAGEIGERAADAAA